MVLNGIAEKTGDKRHKIRGWPGELPNEIGTFDAAKEQSSSLRSKRNRREGRTETKRI